MLRRLSRLLIIAVLLALVAFAVSRLMGGDDDDFDDFEDLDSGFDFQETPVEIDVPATETPRHHAESAKPTEQAAPATPAASMAQTTSDAMDSNATVRLGDAGDENTDNGSQDNNHEQSRLIDINGIGSVYEAKLHSIGINSIHDLAHADADSIASQLEVIGGAHEVSKWITQAQSQHSHE